MTTYTTGQPVWIDGRTPATVVHDAQGATVLVQAGMTPAEVHRDRLAAQGAFLARNEQQPMPANRHYFGDRR